MRETEERNRENIPELSMDPNFKALLGEYIRLVQKVERLEKKLEEQESGTANPEEKQELSINPALENTRKSQRIPPNPPMELLNAVIPKGQKEATKPTVEVSFPEHAAPEDYRKEGIESGAARDEKKQAEERAEEEKEKAYPTRVARNMESRKQKKQHRQPESKPKKNKAWKIIGEVVFYGLLVLLILSALFIRTAGDGAPKSLAGYSGMIVLTESMESEIPKGSLVIAKQVDASTLEIGDDITYMANQTTSVTHRIVGIVENYENTGERAFETQGVMNDRPDNQLVPAVNVVGKVVFHSEALGMIAGFIQNYWPALLIVLVVGIVLVNVLGRIFRKDKEEKPLPETTNHDV